MAMKIHVLVLWVVTHENLGNIDLRNVGALLYRYTVSQPNPQDHGMNLCIDWLLELKSESLGLFVTVDELNIYDEI